MKYLQRLLLVSATLMALVVLVRTPLVAAVNITDPVCNATKDQPVVCQDAQAAQTTNPVFGTDGLVTKGIQIFLVIVGIISVFAIMVNAIKLITSTGDSSSIGKARNGLLYAVIGLVIALSAQVIIITVLRKLG